MLTLKEMLTFSKQFDIFSYLRGFKQQKKFRLNSACFRIIKKTILMI